MLAEALGLNIKPVVGDAGRVGCGPFVHVFEESGIDIGFYHGMTDGAGGVREGMIRDGEIQMCPIDDPSNIHFVRQMSKKAVDGDLEYDECSVGWDQMPRCKV